jgi:hypothetical protein
MKKVVLITVVALMTVAMLATPVLAIGPFNGAEESENDNFVLVAGSLLNVHGNADGSVVWAYSVSYQSWIKWNYKAAEPGKGVLNNALEVIPATDVGTTPADNAAFLALLGSYITEETANKWIFLSGDEGPYTYTFSADAPTYHSYGARGILFWMTFFASKNVGLGNAAAFAIADPIAQMYPYGELQMHNFIQGNPP